MGLTSKEYFSYNSYFQHPYKKANRVIYQHIFKYLKSEGLNWHFRQFYFDFILSLKREIEAKGTAIGRGDEDYSFGTLEAIALFLQLGELDSATGEMVYPDFGTEFANYDLKPNPILKAYIHAYGNNPMGYPPKMTDYI